MRRLDCKEVNNKLDAPTKVRCIILIQNFSETLSSANGRVNIFCVLSTLPRLPFRIMMYIQNENHNLQLINMPSLKVDANKILDEQVVRILYFLTNDGRLQAPLTPPLYSPGM